MMKISLLQTGKTSDRHIAELAEIYSKRINKYCVFEIVTLPDIRNTRNMPVQEQMEKEGKKVLQTLGREDYVVLLDERGTEMRTKEMAVWMEKKFMLAGKRMVFIIGGPWGFSKEVYDRADYTLSLSRLTFPHQLVRLLFLEQLYRVFTVINGEPYHHD
jgi:23S rRNA (pseudouridine1915-N3)-methyltransferase